jgi:TolA-binding protein
LVRLERGAVDVAFHPAERGREHLVVETDSARVEVVGTEFIVELEPRGGTRVEVRQGLVRVTPRGTGVVRLVGAGEETLVEREVAPTDRAGRSDETSAQAEVTEPTTPLPPVRASATLPASRITSGSPRERERAVAEAALAPGISDDEAIDDAALAQLPNDIRFTLAERLLAEGQYDRARHILHWIAREPQTRSDRVRAWTLNAESHARQGRFDHATEAYRRAANGALDSAEGLHALYSLARLKERLEDQAGAKAAYRRYLANAPDGPDAEAARDALRRLAPALPQ